MERTINMVAHKVNMEALVEATASSESINTKENLEVLRTNMRANLSQKVIIEERNVVDDRHLDVDRINVVQLVYDAVDVSLK